MRNHHRLIRPLSIVSTRSMLVPDVVDKNVSNVTKMLDVDDRLSVVNTVMSSKTDRTLGLT